MSRSPLDRRSSARLATAVLFALAAGAFSLPFLAASEERTVRATGLQLMSGRAQFSGQYVHGSYEGDVELIVRRARGPAAAALVLAVLAAALALVPNRGAEWAALALGGLTLLSLGALWQATALQFLTADRRFGFWLAIGCAAAATASVGLRLRAYYGQWRV